MLKEINNTLIRTETWLAAGSILTLLLLSVFQILIRNLFDFGFPEIDIINRHLLVICGMMGAVLATSSFSHIKTDALNTLLSKAVKNKLRLPLAVFASTVCFILCYYCFIFVSDEWQYTPSNERWTLPFTLIYPLGFFLMGAHFLLNEIGREKSAIRNRP